MLPEKVLHPYFVHCTGHDRVHNCQPNLWRKWGATRSGPQPTNQPASRSAWVGSTQQQRFVVLSCIVLVRWWWGKDSLAEDDALFGRRRWRCAGYIPGRRFGFIHAVVGGRRWQRVDVCVATTAARTIKGRTLAGPVETDTNQMRTRMNEWYREMLDPTPRMMMMLMLVMLGHSGSMCECAEAGWWLNCRCESKSQKRQLGRFCIQQKPATHRDTTRNSPRPPSWPHNRSCMYVCVWVTRNAYTNALLYLSVNVQTLRPWVRSRLQRVHKQRLMMLISFKRYTRAP